MQRPDANGFVHINWPSRNIPHGGIFHTRIVEPSSAREQLLKVLLEESKLSIAQRRKDSWALRQDNKLKDEEKSCQQLPIPMTRPRTSRRRSLSEIRVSGALDIDKYRPLKRGEDREKLKQKLQEEMAWGDQKPQQTPPKPAKVPPPAKALPTDKETRNDILTQIRERVEWLADMEALGEGAPHRELIQDQIVERMRMLDILGIDSECSSLCDSGFSTLRSTADLCAENNNAGKSSKRSEKSALSKTSKGEPKKKVINRSAIKKKEENVLAYENVKMQYSPRRRC